MMKLNFLMFHGLIFALFFSCVLATCHQFCANVCKPVCGENSKKERMTFSNQCMMDFYNCANNDSYLVIKNKCCTDDCSTKKICPNCNNIKSTKPFCAENSEKNEMTFSNECEMSSYNCEHNENYVKVRNGCCIKNCPKNPDCFVCKAKYDPICVINSKGVRRTMKSNCSLTSYNCENRTNYTKISKGCCPGDDCPTAECTRICTDDYEPVCAKCPSGESKIFPNSCKLDAFNDCNKENCSKMNPSENCSRVCYQLVKPVCAQCPGGLRTFSNLCFLNVYNNCDNGNCIKIKDGACPEKNCSQICPFIYKPVCAKCPNGMHTFPNLCELNSHNNCSDLYCNKISDGVCPPPYCGLPCPKIFSPVCAKCFDGKLRTFSNLCTLNAFNNCKNEGICNRIRDGFCTMTDKCFLDCPTEYEPVCGQATNGTLKTFANECEMEKFNCNYNETFKKLNNGCCTKSCSKTTEECHRVCAVSNKFEFTEFVNSCEYDNYVCEHPKEFIKLVDRKYCYSDQLYESCQKCEPFCAKNINNEYKTFCNVCDILKYNCKNNDTFIKIKNKKCCASFCPTEIDPICAINENNNTQIFDNECQMEVYNCQNPNDKYEVTEEEYCTTSDEDSS